MEPLEPQLPTPVPEPFPPPDEGTPPEPPLLPEPYPPPDEGDLPSPGIDQPGPTVPGPQEFSTGSR